MSSQSEVTHIDLMQRTLIHRIWVPGVPRSFQNLKSSKKRVYYKKIRDCASAVIQAPSLSRYLEIEVIFRRSRSMRLDADNILKAILDALQGVAYRDDNQIRAVRAVVFTDEDAFGIGASVDMGILSRILTTQKDKREFLINVFNGFITSPF